MLRLVTCNIVADAESGDLKKTAAAATPSHTSPLGAYVFVVDLRQKYAVTALVELNGCIRLLSLSSELEEKRECSQNHNETDTQLYTEFQDYSVYTDFYFFLTIGNRSKLSTKYMDHFSQIFKNFAVLQLPCET